MTVPYTLTPADIDALRGSVRWPLDVELAPDYIRYDATDQHWYIYTEGKVRARHPRVEVVAACLRAERAEPGWMKRALDTRETCLEALLGAEERAARRRQRDASEAAERHALALRDDLSTASLDDFL